MPPTLAMNTVFIQKTLANLGTQERGSGFGLMVKNGKAVPFSTL